MSTSLHIPTKQKKRDYFT